MIVGIVLSPEFIYAIGPGDIMPMTAASASSGCPKALARAYNLDGRILLGQSRCSATPRNAR